MFQLFCYCYYLSLTVNSMYYVTIIIILILWKNAKTISFVLNGNLFGILYCFYIQGSNFLQAYNRYTCKVASLPFGYSVQLLTPARNDGIKNNVNVFYYEIIVTINNSYDFNGFSFEQDVAFKNTILIEPLKIAFWNKT